MNQQEKWVELFKQVVGRVPSPQEFVVGKESGFDFKQIRTIAGLQVASESQQMDSSSVSSLEGLVVPTPQKEPVTNGLNNQVFSGVTQLQANPIVAKTTWSKKKKKTVALATLGIALVVALAGGYYYMDQKTGSDVAALELLDKINKEDYSGLAANFSSDTDKWKQADAKNFLAYLDSQTNIAAELEKMAADPNYIYSDDRGNQLIGMKKTGDFLGLFPTYQVVSYPFEVFAKTNMDSLVLNKEKLAKNKEVSLGSYPFISKEFHLTGKTEFGEVDTVLIPNMADAQNNQVYISLNTTEKTVKANLPKELSNITDKKLFINGKEVATALEKKAKFLENENLTVHVQFSYEGASYTTDKEEITVNPDKDSLVVDLEISDEVAEKIKAASKAKAEKEAAAKKEKETEENIKSFMNGYIIAMRDSIRYRQNQFAQYYDTSSEAYQTMDNYVSNGGVAKNNIDYQTTLDYTVTNISKEGDDYVVTVHNKFREVYLSGKSDIVEKNQVFKLRPNGSSFLIYEISEY